MAEYEKNKKANGWTFQRHGKGDHDIWINPLTNLKAPVDG